jgi:hypothetical protein
MAVERVNHQLEELLDLGLEAAGLAIWGGGAHIMLGVECKNVGTAANFAAGHAEIKLGG